MNGGLTVELLDMLIQRLGRCEDKLLELCPDTPHAFEDINVNMFHAKDEASMKETASRTLCRMMNKASGCTYLFLTKAMQETMKLNGFKLFITRWNVDKRQTNNVCHCLVVWGNYIEETNFSMAPYVEI